jgi:hypothetical protein
MFSICYYLIFAFFFQLSTLGGALCFFYSWMQVTMPRKPQHLVKSSGTCCPFNFFFGEAGPRHSCNQQRSATHTCLLTSKLCWQLIAGEARSPCKYYAEFNRNGGCSGRTGVAELLL